MEDRRKRSLIEATTVGTLLQLAMVVVGHYEAGVAALFGVLGVTISLVAGFVYAMRARDARPGRAATGGAIAGGVCALLGILVSWALGDVTAAVLAFGTLSSAVTGALGGMAGYGLAGRRAPAP